MKMKLNVFNSMDGWLRQCKNKQTCNRVREQEKPLGDIRMKEMIKRNAYCHNDSEAWASFYGETIAFELFFPTWRLNDEKVSNFHLQPLLDALKYLFTFVEEEKLLHPSSIVEGKRLRNLQRVSKFKSIFSFFITISLHSLWAVKCKFSIRLLNYCSNKFEFNFFPPHWISYNEKVFYLCIYWMNFSWYQFLLLASLVCLCIHSEKVNFFFILHAFLSTIEYFFPYDNKYIYSMFTP